ncbi:MAG: alpha/beta hydrolase [Atopobiaceae bacterium]
MSEDTSAIQTFTWRLPADIVHQADGSTVCCGITVTPPAPDAPSRHAAIFYLHGGALIFGTRDDLPKPYIELIRNHGYSLVSVDYPMAPQADIRTICASVAYLWEHAAAELFPKLGCGRTFLCGRSAGAYLALLLASKQQAFPVSGVMDFYGYCDLPHTMSAALWQPSMHYRHLMPAIPPRTARSLRGTQILSSAPIDKRFALYAYARQTGRWGELLGITHTNAAQYSVDKEAQKSLPPLFIAASRADEDVPFRCSAELAEAAHDAETFFVEGLEHDFDRDLSHKEGMEAWQACLAWADRH